MDGVNKLDENDKISNLYDPDAKKQTFGRKSQNWPNLRDKNGILLHKKKNKPWKGCKLISVIIQRLAVKLYISVSGVSGSLLPLLDQ
ncbi:hypothetical protein Hanom_Chr16g01441301 [Helianthus anomalus]